MPQLYNKKSVVICAILIIIILLFGTVLWLLRQKNAPSSLYSGAPSRIVIGNIGEYSLLNIIAKEKGFFDEYGLDAHIQEYESGPPVIQALSEGKVDVGVAADFVGVRSIFVNPKIRVLTQAGEHQVFYMIGRKDHGMNEPSDLKGKKIGVTKTSAGEFFLARFLTFNNIRQDEIEIIDLPPAEIVTQIKDGTLAGGVIFDPHAFNLAQELGPDGVQWSVQGNQNIFALIYTTDSFINQQSDVAERYLSALLKAEQYIEQYPNECKTILSQTMGYAPTYVEHSWPHFSHRLGLSQELVLTMEDEAQWAIETGVTDTAEIPNYLDYIYLNGLERVKPTAMTIIH